MLQINIRAFSRHFLRRLIWLDRNWYTIILVYKAGILVAFIFQSIFRRRELVEMAVYLAPNKNIL